MTPQNLSKLIEKLVFKQQSGFKKNLVLSQSDKLVKVLVLILYYDTSTI